MISIMKPAPMFCTKSSSLLVNDEPSSNTNTSMNGQRRWQLALMILGLLFAEYSMQHLYYQYTQSKLEGNNNGYLRAVIVPKSTEFIDELELDTCRFPLYYDKSRFKFHLRDNHFVEPGDWRERNYEFEGKEDAHNVYNALVREERLREDEQRAYPYLPRVTRNLTFVHIGKAGGSSVACNLRSAHKYVAHHCDNDVEEDDDDDDNMDDADPFNLKPKPVFPESAISRHVNCYTHWRMHLKCFYLQGEDPFEGMILDGRKDKNFGARRLHGKDEADTKEDGFEVVTDAKIQKTKEDVDGHSSGSHATASQKQKISSKESNGKGKDIDPHKHKELSDVSSSRDNILREVEERQRMRRGNDYLVNLRSPVDRIASWFVYEHTENHDSVYPGRPYHCGQLILSSCYQHFEHMTTIGLSYPRPHPSQPLKVGTNLSATECSHWAWAAVQGTMPADYHNGFNYAWYAHRLLHDSRNQDSDIFVLRVEHLEQDWSTVDRILGGDGSFPAALEAKQNSAKIKPLRVPDHNTTDIGLVNLCRALCDEIQVYKQLLVRAINLQPEDLEISMQELRQQCPHELSIEPRHCNYDI